MGATLATVPPDAVIPVLIVPVLADAERLYEMIRSINHPVDTLVVIDNGAPVSRHRLNELNRTHVGRRYLLQMPSNLGVATSWNLGIKATPFAPWWLVANFDVIWLIESLERFAAEAGPDRLLLSGGAPPWCAFAIGEQVVSKVGLFDEGLHPAYWEDIDYRRRCDALGVQVVESDIDVFHSNSSTLAAGYHRQNLRSFAPNAERATLRAARGDMSNGEWSLEARRALSWD